MDEKCLKPGCERPALARGLCSKDYAYAKSLVNRGKTTWDRLVKLGRALASGRRGRPVRNDPWFLKGAK